MCNDKKMETKLFDIFIAIQKIKEVISLYSDVNDLLHDFRSWDSILRELDIIGVAGRKLVKCNYFRQEYLIIIYLSNTTRDRYFAINKELIWSMLNRYIDSFEAIIVELIRDIEYNRKIALIDAFIDENYYLDFVVESLNKLKR